MLTFFTIHHWGGTKHSSVLGHHLRETSERLWKLMNWITKSPFTDKAAPWDQIPATGIWKFRSICEICVCVCVKRFANWRLKDWGYLRTSINHEKPLQCAQKTWIFHLKLNSFQSQIFGFQGAKKKKNNCGPEAMDWPTRCQLVIRDAVKGIP